MINKSACHNDFLMHYLRGIFWISKGLHFTLRCLHIPGINNDMADCVSCLHSRGHILHLYSLISQAKPFSPCHLAMLCQQSMSPATLFHLLQAKPRGGLSTQLSSTTKDMHLPHRHSAPTSVISEPTWNSAVPLAAPLYPCPQPTFTLMPPISPPNCAFPQFGIISIYCAYCIWKLASTTHWREIIFSTPYLKAYSEFMVLKHPENYPSLLIFCVLLRICWICRYPVILFLGCLCDSLPWTSQEV